MTLRESHRQCRPDEVFIGHTVSSRVEPIARRYQTLRLGNPEDVALGDSRMPLFIKRSEAERQGLVVDSHGNAVPLPESF